MEFTELPTFKSLMSAITISALVWGTAIVAFIIY
jgi:hypothetical protein